MRVKLIGLKLDLLSIKWLLESFFKTNEFSLILDFIEIRRKFSSLSRQVMIFFQLSILTLSFFSIASIKVQLNVTAPVVFDLIQSNSDLSILNSMMDMIPAFKRNVANGNFTFLAPTDTALKAFNESNPDDFAIFESDSNFLTDFLQSNTTSDLIFRLDNT